MAKMHQRGSSVPDQLTEEAVQKKKSAFPKDYDHSGWLDVRTRATKPWKRRYFVLANNFLLCGVTPHATKLEKVIPLEGSNVKTTIRTSTMTFEILHKKKRHTFRAGNIGECTAWTEKISRASRLKIKDVYQFQEILGQNPDGSTQVWAARHRVRGDNVAIKIISKRKYDPKALQNEVLILKRLDHPNVVKLYDLFETRNSVYLVMEKCLGGELFEQIAALDGHGFCEKDCITVIHQIAKAVKYMHSMGIVHRDLKPENILCVDMNSIKKIKIADFGISKVVFDPEQRRREKEKHKRQIAQRNRIRKKQMQEALDNKEKNGSNSNSISASASVSNGAETPNDTSAIEDGDEDVKSASEDVNTNVYVNANGKVSVQQGQQQQQRKGRHGSKQHGKHKKREDPLKKRHGQPKGYGAVSGQQQPQHAMPPQDAQDAMKRQSRSKGHGSSHVRDESDDYKRSIEYTMTTMCGTISYTAPEILQELPYDRRVDYWSLGVIMYILLCGYPPFAGESEIEVARAILRDEIEIEPEDWEHVSEQGKQLVLGLLEKDPKKRKSCDDIIGHSWIQTAKSSTSKRARQSMIKTVVKRRIRKMSMGVFEQNSKRMNKMYKSRDDSSSGSRRSISGSSTTLGARHSKTEDELFELRIPSSYGTQQNSLLLEQD